MQHLAFSATLHLRSLARWSHEGGDLQASSSSDIFLAGTSVRGSEATVPIKLHQTPHFLNPYAFSQFTKTSDPDLHDVNEALQFRTSSAPLHFCSDLTRCLLVNTSSGRRGVGIVFSTDSSCTFRCGESLTPGDDIRVQKFLFCWTPAVPDVVADELNVILSPHPLQNDFHMPLAPDPCTLSETFTKPVSGFETGDSAPIHAWAIKNPNIPQELKLEIECQRNFTNSIN